MKNITIRKATIEDAAEIANVHVNSWREAYQGLLPSSFLDERPLLFKNKYEIWKKVTVNTKQVTLVAVSENHGVVGFVNGAGGRDDDYKDYAEIWCFYLLEKYHGQKIGFNLLRTFFNEQASLGYRKGYLWVLADNPTINFYEKSGGKFFGLVKEDEIGGQKVKELCFVWENLQL